MKKRSVQSVESQGKLSHYDKKGRATMVDVSAKSDTRRTAEASAFVRMKPEVLKALPQNKKGSPLEVARVAGIMAAKRTSDLIPMCHPLNSIAALTVYDMCKALDKGIEIREVVLERKSGGKSGEYRRTTKIVSRKK